MSDQVTELAAALGWQSIPSKNPHMISFMREDYRINYYYTNGTITKQSPHTQIKTIRDAELDDIEILML